MGLVEQPQFGVAGDERSQRRTAPLAGATATPTRVVGEAPVETEAGERAGDRGLVAAGGRARRT